MHYLMPVIQLYISSSVEACPLWKCCLYVCLVHLIIIIYYCHYYRDNGSQLLSRCTTRYLNYFTCDVKSNWKLQENCAINAQVANHLKTAVIVTFSCAISGFTSNSRAPGGPVTFWWPMWGQRLPKLQNVPIWLKCAKTAKKCAKLKKSQNHQKQHFQG